MTKTTMNTTTTMNVKTNSFSSVNFERFCEMVSFCDDWKVRTIAMLAELRVFFRYDELFVAKRYLDKGELIGYAHNRTRYLAETSIEEIQRTRQLALAKAVRHIVDLNNLYKRTFGHPFMRKIKKNDEGFFDIHDTVRFFMDFELEFNRHYNPENIHGYNLCDIQWNFSQLG